MIQRILPTVCVVLFLLGRSCESLAQETAAPGNVPQLIKSVYAAEFSGDALVNGTGEWTIQQSAPVPVLLPLPDINIAMQAMTFNKREAIVGERGGLFGLLLEEKGTQTCNFNWTCGAVRGVDAAQFDLRLPSCPVCKLELLVPADHHVTESTGRALLIGPLSAADPRLRRWQIHSSGGNQLLLSVARTTEPGSGPLVLAQLQSSQQLLPLSLNAVFDFRIEVLHHALEKLTFVLPAELEPFDVAIPDHELKNWQVLPVVGKPEKLLVATFARPVRGLIKSMQIRCLAPLPAKGGWTSPGMDLKDSAFRGETLDLILHPDVQLDNWQPGNFQLRESRSADPKLPDSKFKEGVHALKLAFAGGDRAASKRPGGVLKTHEPQYLVEEHLRWEVSPGTLALQTTLNVRVVRGRLFQLPLNLLPSRKYNWRVRSLKVEPLSLVHDWSVAGSQLLINFQSVLGERNSAKITFTLQSDQADVPHGGLSLDFPDVLPVGTAVRTGSFGIFVDAAYHADSMQTTMSPAAPPYESGLPPPQHYFAFRATPVSGKLHIVPHQARLRVDSYAKITLAPTAPQLAWTVALEPLTGNPESAIVFTCPVLQGRLSAETSGGKQVQLDLLPDISALLSLGARHGIDALLVRKCVPPCNWWRVAFVEPLKKREVVQFQTHNLTVPFATHTAQTAVQVIALAAPPLSYGFTLVAIPFHADRADPSFDVPQLCFVGMERFRNQTTLLTQGVELTEIRRSGLEEVLPDDDILAPGDIPHLYRSLPDAVPSLRLSWRNRADRHAAERFADFGILRTFVEPHGQLRHHFRFGVWDWPEAELTIELPAATREILSVKADDCWITSFTRESVPDGIRLRLPLGRSSERRVFDIEYTTNNAADAPLLWGTLHTTVPRLATMPLSIRQIWRLPSSLTPMIPSNYVCRPLPENMSVSWADIWTPVRLPGAPLPQSEALDWEIVPGDLFGDRVLVVNATNVNLLSVAVGVLLFLVAWAARVLMSPRWQFRLLSLWLIAGVLGIIWLPTSLSMIAWSTTTVGMVLALLWLLRGLFAARPPKSRSPLLTSVGVVVLLASLATGVSARAGEVENGLANEAMIVSAQYKGQIIGQRAEFVAQYRIDSLADDGVLVLPLAGVDLLEGARLDDTVVYPLALPKDRGAYRIAIPMKGVHKLQIAFRVRLTPGLDVQNMQFGIPRTADNKLELIVPESFREIVAVRALGTQSVSSLPDNAQLLSANLGPANLAHIRWRQSSGGGGTNILVRENYFWDLQLPEAALVAILDYQVKSGLVTDLLIELPEDLDVRSVKTNEAPSPGPQIDEWKILANKGRRLRVQFAQPLLGDVRLHIEFLPRLTSSNEVLLRLPYPMRVKDILEGTLAYRLPEGVQAQETRQNLGVLQVPASTIAWQTAFPRQIGGPTSAYRFGRRPTNAVSNAALQLSLVHPRPRISEELTWRIHPDYADLVFVCHINPPLEHETNPATAKVMLLELDVPKEITLAEVKGGDVLYWTRTENQTQIWLQTTDAASDVTVSGWVKHPLRLLPGKVGRYALPQVRIRGNDSLGRQIAIDPVQGVALEPLADLALAKLAAGNPLLAAGALRSAPVRPDVAILTTATLDELKNLDLVARLDFRIPFGTFRPLTLIVKNWPSVGFQFETPKGVRLHHLDSSNGDQTYRVQIDPEVTRQFQLTLRSRYVLDSADMIMPNLQIVEATRAQNWLAILGDGLQVQEATNLVSSSMLTSGPSLWPQLAAKLANSGTLWRADDPDARLRLAARRQPETPLRVVCAERHASFSDNSWLHEARLLFFGTQRHTDVHLPAGCKLAAMLIDGRRVTPHFQGDNNLRLHFPDAALVHTAQIWWRMPDESLTEPKFELPRLGADKAVAWIATLEVPRGFHLVKENGKPPVFGDHSFALLAKASACSELTRFLLSSDLGGPRLNSAVALAQDEFRSLSVRLSESAKSLADADPALARKVSASLTALEKRNQELQRLARERLVPLTAGPADDARSELSEAGTSVSILNPGSTLSTEIKLIPVAALVHEQRLFATEFAIVGFIGMLLLSLLPSVFADRLRSIWPEQLLVLAAVAWTLFGFSLLVGLAVAVAVLGRVAALVIWLNPQHARGVLITPGSSFRT